MMGMSCCYSSTGILLAKGTKTEPCTLQGTNKSLLQLVLEIQSSDHSAAQQMPSAVSHKPSTNLSYTMQLMCFRIVVPKKDLNNGELYEGAKVHC